MTRLLLSMFAVLLFGATASADWGDGQDIADQWAGPAAARGGSGNPYGNPWNVQRGGWHDDYYRGHRPHKQYRKAKRACPPCRKAKPVQRRGRR